MNEGTQKEDRVEILPPSALESLERAAIDMQIATARRYPRTLSVVVRKMTELVTLDEDTAGSCFYRLARQGKSIEGPTIRLAEIAVSAYGNIRFGARVIANDGKEITAQGFCHDLENNVLVAMEVKRRITNKEGQTYSADMQTVTGNAACAIAARNAVFKVIPFAMVKPIMATAKQTAIGDIKTLADRRTRMLAKLASLGVNEKRACAAVNKTGVEDIGLEELETLFGLYNAVKEEDQTVEEAFPEVKKPPQFGDAGIPEQKMDRESPTSVPTEEKKLGRPKKDTTSEPGPTGPTGVQEPAPDRATPLQTLQNLMKASNRTEKNVLVYLFSTMTIEQGDTLDKMPDDKIQKVIDSWISIAPEIPEGE